MISKWVISNYKCVACCIDVSEGNEEHDCEGMC
jgi:hypothetical protein